MSLSCGMMNDMQFLTKDSIGSSVTDVLSQATKVRIASAFFCPSNKTLELLNTIPDLTLVISEEFTINDPAKLERLSNAVKQSVPPDSEHGKLHAKIIIADMPDRSTWVLLGSANLTEQGLFYNQEACIALSSKQLSDQGVISETKTWFDQLLKKSNQVDIGRAKAIWAAQRMHRRSIVQKDEAAPAYWAIKTTEGGGEHSPEHWPMFERENVVAIGWEKVLINPANVNDEELLAAVKAAYPGEKPGTDKFSARTIRDFVDIPNSSIILVCRGYTPNQRQHLPVHVYALARVTGDLAPEPYVKGEWRFRRPVVLQTVNKSLSVDTMRKILKLGSLRQTMHELSQTAVEGVASELGIQILI